MSSSIHKNDSDRLEREACFHDHWAESENIDSIDVRSLFESVAAMENSFILSHMGALQGKRILDIGCGLGESAVYFALKGARVTATDLAPQMINFTRQLARRHSITLDAVAAPAEELRFDESSFDFVYCANLIHHLSAADRPRFARSAHRVLKKGGWFYSWDPLAYNPAINIYRKMAKDVRSSDEHPLTFGALRDFGNVFASVKHREFWLTTLALFFKYYLVDRLDPNKVRYWKQIYKEQPVNIGWWFNALKKIDRIALSLPLVNRLAWNIVIYAQK